MNRRHFIQKGASSVALSLSGPAFAIRVPYRAMTHVERVDAALNGKSVDRPPYTIYQSIKRSSAERESRAQLEFHDFFNTDIVKVSNTHSYPASKSQNWFDVEVVDSPYQDHLRTLQMIRKGLRGRAYFVDSISSPVTTAWTLFSKPQGAGMTSAVDLDANQVREFREFQQSNNDAWASAIEAITQSTINHLRKLKDVGAAGAFVSAVNMSSMFGTPEEYCKFSKPYDDRIFHELSDMKLAILHLMELDRAFVDQLAALQAPIVHYSTVRTGIPISDVRRSYAGTIMGGVDEIAYSKLSVAKIRTQWATARAEAGPRFIAAPGGPIPSACTGWQIGHLQASLSAW